MEHHVSEAVEIASEDLENGQVGERTLVASAKAKHAACFTPYRLRFVRYCAVDVRVNAFMEFQLLLLSFGTGIQDAISYPDFRCFASNQTGNTVVLAVALAGGANNLFDPSNVGVSLTTFVAGALLTGRIGSIVGPRRRFWQFGVSLAQTLMVLGAAWIQYVHGVRAGGAWARATLGLIALASGSQVAAARAMKIPEIPTAMATAAWVDLLIDDDLMRWDNRSRNRRVLFLGALVAGSFVGAFARARLGSPTALMISCIIKGLVSIALLAAEANESVAGSSAAPPSAEAG